MVLLSPLLTFLFPLLLLCATAPVGATVLGWVAVTRIRRSDGALYGMPFAVFGGLIFPLLALDYVLAYALFSFAEGFLGWTEDYDPSQHAQFAFAVCVLWTLADALIVRAVWRAVNRGRKGLEGNGGPREGTVHLWPTVVLHSVLFVLLYGLFFVGMVKYGAIRRDMGFHDVAGTGAPTTELLLAAVALVFGLVLAGDIAVCFLIRRTKGRRALFWWSGAVMAGLFLFAAVSGAELWMRLRPVIEKIAPSPSPLQLRLAAGPPFTGRLAHGTVELLALAPNPSAYQPTWYPNGLPFDHPFPNLNGTDTAAGKSVREIAFRVKGEGESPSYPLLRFEPGSGVTGMGSSDTWNDSKQTSLTFVEAIACPPEAREANVKVGVAEGAWETVLHIRKPTETSPVAGGQTSVKEGVAQGAWERGFHIGKPAETSLAAGEQRSGSDGVWEGAVEMTHGKNGDIAVAFHYTVSQDFESRVAYVKADGSVSPLRGDGSQGMGGLMNSIASLRAAEFAQIQEFQLQRRPYQWVEFRNVSLQPGTETSVGIVDAPGSETPTMNQSGAALPSPDVPDLYPPHIPATERTAIEAKLRTAIAGHLRGNAANLGSTYVNFDALAVSVTPDLQHASIKLGNPYPEKEFRGGSVNWGTLRGGLQAQYEGGGVWEITGDGQLGAYRFTVDTAAEMGVAPASNSPTEKGGRDAAVAVSDAQSLLQKKLLHALEEHLSASAAGASAENGEFIDYAGLSADVSPDLRRATIKIDQPRPRWSSPHKAIWKAVPNGHWSAEFIAANEGNGRWNVNGMAELGALAFEVRIPEAATTPSTPALTAERPQLRFLAWQDQWKTNHPDKPEGAFHADGSPVIDPAEVRLLGIVEPTACDHGGSGTDPRFAYLWFSHPLFDEQSLIDVTILDAGGRAIPPGAEGMMASGGRVADQIDDHLGWLTYSFSPGTASSPVAIRLRYAIGPEERLRQFSPDEQGIVALGNGSQFNGIGQDSTGKSFFAIAVDMKQDASRQFGVTAFTKDGRVWPSMGGSRGGGIGEAVAVQRFVFAPPLSEIAHFQLGSRPIRTVDFDNVILPGKPLPASHTGLPFVAPAESGPRDSPQAAWGEPVQGVECQLRAFNGGKYQSGLPPGFVAAVRNVGKEDWEAQCAQQLCELELDGMRYSWTGACDINWKALPPGRDYEDIPISLTVEWLSADKHWLVLRPGKHVLRAAFEAAPPPKTPGTPVRCVSNPVEFEIVDTDSWESPNHPSPALDGTFKGTKLELNPAIERVLEPAEEDHRALNLVSGNFVAGSKGQKAEFVPREAASPRSPGADLYVQDEEPTTLKTLDMQACYHVSPAAGASPVPRVDTISPDDLAQTLSRMGAWRKTLAQSEVPGLDQLPSVTSITGTDLYIFVTRDGAKGALQIAPGSPGHSPGVTVRYRLLAR